MNCSYLLAFRISELFVSLSKKIKGGAVGVRYLWVLKILVLDRLDLPPHKAGDLIDDRGKNTQ